MAKTWRNKKTILEISGFEELYEKLQKAGVNAETEGRKLFEKSMDVMYDELYAKGKAAKLAEYLLEEIDEKYTENEKAGIWRYEVGWKKTKPNNPLPNTYKVMFYNYGTPNERFTKSGQSRGQESPHPKDSHGFIKKAKISASKKLKKLQKETLERITRDLRE